jgi:hypothetical protein
METLNIANVNANNALQSDFMKNSLQDEMTDHRLPRFAEYVDSCYRDAWVQHYSNFQANTPLLNINALLEFYVSIETLFPLHFLSLSSILWSKRSHEPARAQSQHITNKKNILVHYFFCLVREQDTHHLIHWAMVSTIALHYRGIDSTSYRNSMGRSFTADLPSSLDRLEEIYEATAPKRAAVLASQRFVTNVLDNYNRHSRFTTQRCGSSGLFHNGIVTSAIRVHEFNKPRGTILVNTSGETWRVVSSALSSNFAVNTVFAEQVHMNNQSHEYSATGVFLSIELPSNSWKVSQFPSGGSERVEINYFSQQIPSSLRMLVPQNVTDKEFIMGSRLWMVNYFTDNGPRRTLAVREYYNLVTVAQNMSEIIDAMHHPTTMAVGNEVIDVGTLFVREKIPFFSKLLGNEKKTV